MSSLFSSLGSLSRYYGQGIQNEQQATDARLQQQQLELAAFLQEDDRQRALRREQASVQARATARGVGFGGSGDSTSNLLSVLLAASRQQQQRDAATNLLDSQRLALRSRSREQLGRLRQQRYLIDSYGQLVRGAKDVTQGRIS
ncbi:MAG: hypothetical protein GDA50_02485 [Alphaproteobacteria bacterium GM202ARS2]|nr:hypothetical protein [Alphaproteobacteria bacterium GM202ARS2]